jgi:hypothetical protein
MAYLVKKRKFVSAQEMKIYRPRGSECIDSSVHDSSVFDVLVTFTPGLLYPG